MVTTRHQRHGEIARSRHRRGATGATSRALVVSRPTRGGRAPPAALVGSTHSSRASVSDCRAALARRQACPQTCRFRPITKARRQRARRHPPATPVTSNIHRAAPGGAAPPGAPLGVRPAWRRRPARPLRRGTRARRGRAALPALLLLLLLLLLVMLAMAMAGRLRMSWGVGWSGLG